MTQAGSQTRTHTETWGYRRRRGGLLASAVIALRRTTPRHRPD